MARAMLRQCSEASAEQFFMYNLCFSSILSRTQIRFSYIATYADSFYRALIGTHTYLTACLLSIL